MYNLRYHIASLVAVFLSLAVGLLLGSVVVERGTLDRQRDGIVKSLQEDFSKLADENRELRDEYDRHIRFGEQALPLLVAGRLEGRAVLVLAEARRGEGLAAVTEAIRLAGGDPVLVRLRAERFGLDDEDLAQGLADTLGFPVTEESLVAALAAEWTSAGPRPLTERLRESNVLDGDAMPEGEPGGLVLMASWDGEPDGVAVDLAERVANRGLPVVGAEAFESKTGVPEAAIASGLSAIDHADTPEGYVSLVWLLAGHAEGYIGLGPGADAPFPRMTAR